MEMTGEQLIRASQADTWAALNDPAIRERLAGIGLEVVASSPAQLNAMLPGEVKNGVDENISFEVLLQRSGKALRVATDKSIMETLLEAGLDVSYSCQQGICGTCETKVISGIPDHRDMFLNEDEQDSNKVMMICCSRSKTPLLVLDL